MQAINERAESTLIWTQPNTNKQVFELHVGEDLLATLEWGSMWHWLATATLAEGRFIFNRMGVFNVRITVRAEGSEENLATFQPNWYGGGTLTFPDGRTFQWKSVNFWGGAWVWVNSAEQQLLRFQSKGKLLRTEADVVVEPLGQALAELPLLTAIGWYLVVSAAYSSSSTAVIVAAT